MRWLWFAILGAACTAVACEGLVGLDDDLNFDGRPDASADAASDAARPDGGDASNRPDASGCSGATFGADFNDNSPLFLFHSNGTVTLRLAQGVAWLDVAQRAGARGALASSTPIDLHNGTLSLEFREPPTSISGVGLAFSIETWDGVHRLTFDLRGGVLTLADTRYAWNRAVVFSRSEQMIWAFHHTGSAVEFRTRPSVGASWVTHASFGAADGLFDLSALRIMIEVGTETGANAFSIGLEGVASTVCLDS